MDGLSAAASAIAVVSLAVQIAESLRELCDFWDSIQEAPEHIRVILKDLRLLELVIIDIRRSGELHGVDAITSLAVESCSHKVTSLVTVVNEIEPGFRDPSRRKRTWSSFKAALKGEKLKKFRDSLNETKLTLVLARLGFSDRINQSLFQSHQRSLTLISESQQQSIATITETLQQLGIVGLSRTTSTSAETLQDVRRDHLADLQREAQVVTSTIPIARLQPRVAEAISQALDKPNSLGHVEEEIGRRPETMGHDHMIQSPKRSSRGRNPPNACLESISNSEISTPFGNIRMHSRTWREYTPDADKIDSGAIEAPFHAETNFTFFPALWLMRLGMRTGLDVMVYASSLGWKNTLTIKPFRAVPDDSLIFDFIESGNIDGIKTLFSRGDATVWDRNSNGETPLHYAASHLQTPVCKLLLDSGADLTALDLYGNSPADEAVSLLTLGTNDTHTYRIDTLRLFTERPEFKEHPPTDGIFSSPYLSLLEASIFTEVFSEDIELLHESSVSKWLVSTYCHEIKYELDSKSLLALCKRARNPYFIEYVCNLTDNTHLYSRALDIAQIRSIIEEDHWMRRRSDLLTVQDLVYLFRKGISVHSNWDQGTITTMTLEHPSQFRIWYSVLQRLEVDIDQFIKKELELNDPKMLFWTVETLRNLFENWKCADSIDTGLGNASSDVCPCVQGVGISRVHWSPWDIAVYKLMHGEVVSAWDENPLLCGVCRLCSPLTRWRNLGREVSDKDILRELGTTCKGARCCCYHYRHLEGYPQSCSICENRQRKKVRELSIPGAFEPIYI